MTQEADYRTRLRWPIGGFWGAVDTVAHFLHAPTMLGRRAARFRWHHRIHLLPGALLARICDRYDVALGINGDRVTVVGPDGFGCAHMQIWSPHLVAPPSLSCGCTPLPMWTTR